MSERRHTAVSPSVYEQIVVQHNRRQFMRVPTGEAAIRDVAQWVASFGDTEVRDIGPDGFRYRCHGGHWHWAQPDDWMVRLEGEFDLPTDGHPLWGDGWQHVDGPPLPPRWGYDDEDAS